MPFKINAEIVQCGGKLLKLTHDSTATKTPMNVNVFIPPSSSSSKKKIPVLLYLSGLTCTPENATEKSFFQYWASKYGFALVFPDTSPRGADIAGENDSWDFGTGAGFYVNATQEPWSKNYNMYTYVHEELPAELAKEFAQLDFKNVGITGHSMGGMGALVGFFRQKDQYRSVSAFAPIANPSVVPWGEKNFGNYLGDDKKAWAEYDPTELVKKYDGVHTPGILIHQGLKDPFYERELKPGNFIEAAGGYKGDVDLQLVDGYDHLYFFISSFVEEHAKHHAKYLGLL
ncbi:S-formylglutathione hydrolase [Candida viswanathii]|uniref:S-formylglutathione hydrolase n=1 Tax=Candida viswanathii TaxID=5486 RepID=A0A367YLW1_9ASCO|nr:S-formylglutathione hydrolase [Candida viswanathii]